MKKFVFLLFYVFWVFGEENVIDDNKSFSENLKNLEIPDRYNLDEIVIGDKNAPHTLIIYSSFSCKHCKKFHQEEFPKLKKDYIDTRKLKVYLRNYIDDLGALESAILMRFFLKTKKDPTFFYRIIFENQENWLKSPNPREFLIAIFEKSGFKKDEVKAHTDPSDRDYRDISAGLIKEQKRAMHMFKIQSVPAFVLDGRVHEGMLSYIEIVEKMNLNKVENASENIVKNEQKASNRANF